MGTKWYSWADVRSRALDPAWAYVLLAISSGLGLALVFASGPLVQAIAVAFLSGQTSSIYDGQNVGQLVNAKTYIETALWPPYIAAGVFSAIAMVQASTKWSVLAWGTIAIGTSLTVIDASTLDTKACSFPCCATLQQAFCCQSLPYS